MKADMKPTLLLAAMLMLAHPHAHAAESATAFDMVDLRLGMTLAQAKKALLAYDPAMRITEERSHYVYGDGAGVTLKTPDFVAYINGDRKVGASGSEGIALYFTPLPGDQKVVAIVRTLHNMPDPPTGRQYRDSLTKKYGKPVKAESGGLVRWEFPAGRVSCLVNDSFGAVFGPGSGTRFLRQIFQGGVPGRFNKPGIQDLSQCASYLEYNVGLETQAAAFVTAHMVDVEGYARGELSARQWVADLTAEARKAREARGTAPRL